MGAEMALTKVRSVEDAVSVGQVLDVVCTGRDTRGNIKISKKALLAREGE